MKVYVAAAIDRNKDPYLEFERLSIQIRSVWPAQPVPLVLFLPCLAFSKVGRLGRDEQMYLADINEHAAHAADAMLFKYSPGVESWGVPQELLMADRWNKPTYLWLDPESPGVSELPYYLQIRTNPDRTSHNIAEIVYWMVSDYEQHTQRSGEERPNQDREENLPGL